MVLYPDKWNDLSVTRNKNCEIYLPLPWSSTRVIIRCQIHRDSVNGHICFNYFTCFSYLLSVFIKSLTQYCVCFVILISVFCLIRNMNSLHFTSTWVHPRLLFFFMGSVLLIFFIFCFVLSYYRSLRSEFRVVMSITISA